jgi:hypothetical protein
MDGSACAWTPPDCPGPLPIAAKSLRGRAKFALGCAPLPLFLPMNLETCHSRASRLHPERRPYARAQPFIRLKPTLSRTTVDSRRVLPDPHRRAAVSNGSTADADSAAVHDLFTFRRSHSAQQPDNENNDQN